ncbi:phosphate ABC transporter, permease protein, partial [Streptococcus agalactiae COH1]
TNGCHHVAGNQAVLPQSLTSGVRTLTTNMSWEMGYSSGLHRQALIGTAVVLFIFILMINISFSALQKEE